MRVTTILRNGATAAGRIDGDEITLLPFPDVRALLESGPDWRRTAENATAGETLPLSHATLAPLVPMPEKVICVGLNYRDHIEETGRQVPAHPTLFAKFGRTLIGAHDDIILPRDSQKVDWEVELGVVIGSPARRVSATDALAAVAGYTIVNDVSMRDWQRRTSQFLQGKAFEASTPVGPWLVTPDEVDHARDLALTCAVDGELRQRSRTSRLVFPVAEIVSYISRFVTLMPGDLIATGTPGGIGAAQTPPRFLQPGEVVTSTIEGIGKLVNHCRPEPV